MTDKLETIRRKCIEANPYLGDIETREYYREPRLADVLLAMDTQGKSHHEVNGDECFICAGLWNLREDNLTKQSPETIDFLHSLLA